MKITVGSDPDNRTSEITTNQSFIEIDGASNGTGIITKVQIFVEDTIEDLKIGIFRLVSGTTYECVSASSTLANQTAGLKTISGLSLPIRVGDKIGFYASAGKLSKTQDTGTGYYYKAGDHATVGDETEYSGPTSSTTLSIQGTSIKNTEQKRRRAMAVQIYDNRKVVTAAGTAEAITSSREEVIDITITAETDNTGFISVGASTTNATATTQRGCILSAGDSKTLYGVDLAKVYLDASVSGDGVGYVCTA